MSFKSQRLLLVLICSIYVSKPKNLSKNILLSSYLSSIKYVFALDTILKHAFEILQNAYDNRDKLHAIELFKDTHLIKLELLSNATTIDSALNYIRDKQQVMHKKG